ncbi:hypothetical protein HPB47_012870, partial [Ixodes persulcatus]
DGVDPLTRVRRQLRLSRQSLNATGEIGNLTAKCLLLRKSHQNMLNRTKSLAVILYLLNQSLRIRRKSTIGQFPRRRSCGLWSVDSVLRSASVCHADLDAQSSMPPGRKRRGSSPLHVQHKRQRKAQADRLRRLHEPADVREKRLALRRQQYADRTRRSKEAAVTAVETVEAREERLALRRQQYADRQRRAREGGVAALEAPETAEAREKRLALRRQRYADRKRRAREGVLGASDSVDARENGLALRRRPDRRRRSRELVVRLISFHAPRSSMHVLADLMCKHRANAALDLGAGESEAPDFWPTFAPSVSRLGPLMCKHRAVRGWALLGFGPIQPCRDRRHSKSALPRSPLFLRQPRVINSNRPPQPGSGLSASPDILQWNCHSLGQCAAELAELFPTYGGTQTCQGPTQAAVFERKGLPQTQIDMTQYCDKFWEVLMVRMTLGNRHTILVSYYARQTSSYFRQGYDSAGARGTLLRETAEAACLALVNNLDYPTRHGLNMRNTSTRMRPSQAIDWDVFRSTVVMCKATLPIVEKLQRAKQDFTMEIKVLKGGPRSWKDRQLQATDHVCEKHFEPCLVSKTWKAEYNGRVLVSTPRRACLSKDAVPTRFLECPSYLLEVEKPRRRGCAGRHLLALAEKKSAVSSGGSQRRDVDRSSCAPSTSAFDDDDGGGTNATGEERRGQEGTARGPRATAVSSLASSLDKLPPPCLPSKSGGCRRLETSEGLFGADQFKIALRRSNEEKEGNATDVQSDSDTQESESILPDDGPGWGSSSDNSLTRAVTIKTEPPEYVEQDEEPSSHLVSVKTEPLCYEDVQEPNSLVPALKKDYTDVTKVTFHFNAEPQVSEETRRWHNTTVAVKIELPDPTEVHSEAVSTDTGLEGSGSNTAMTAVTIKTEPPEFVEQDEEPNSHLVSVKSEPEGYEEVWEPRNPVPALMEGEPPDYTDVTKATFRMNPELQVSKGALQRGNGTVAVKIEPQDPTGVDAPAIFLEAGLGAAAPKEFQQDPVPTNAIGSYAVVARPLQWVPTSVRDEAQPQANVVYLHSMERHGIAIQPMLATLPVVAVQPERPDVTPPSLAGLGPGVVSLPGVWQHRVLVDPTVAMRPPRHAPPAICDGLRPPADEAVGPQGGKSQLEQFYELFLGGFDYWCRFCCRLLSSLTVQASFLGLQLGRRNIPTCDTTPSACRLSPLLDRLFMCGRDGTSNTPDDDLFQAP